MADAVLRAAREEDLDRIAELAATLVRLHHAWDSKRFMMLEPIEVGYRRFLASQLGDADTLLLVAELEGHIVGYLYGCAEGRNWQLLCDRHGAIHDVLVDEAARRHGVAQALVERACEWFTERKLPRVVLFSASANAQAQSLFKKLGFRPTMVEMTRELSS